MNNNLGEFDHFGAKILAIFFEKTMCQPVFENK
jgi:hypothetical protein